MPHHPLPGMQALLTCKIMERCRWGSGWLTRRCFSENYPIKSPSLPCFSGFTPPPTVVALSPKAINMSPDRVLAALSCHCGHWGPCRAGLALWGATLGCWEAWEINTNLNIYTDTQKIISGGGNQGFSPLFESPSCLLRHHLLNKPK